jgi:hypothetical protein
MTAGGDATIEDLKNAVVNYLRDVLRLLKEDLRAVMLAIYPFKAGDIIKTKNGEDMKIVRIEMSWGVVQIIAVPRTNDGSWDSREQTLHSWDLP